MDVYIGLDVSLASTAICVLGENGKIVTEAQVASAPDSLVAFLRELPHEIAVIGTEDEIHRRFQEHAEMGVHTHIVAPLGANQVDMDRTFGAFTASNFRFE